MRYKISRPRGDQVQSRDIWRRSLAFRPRKTTTWSERQSRPGGTPLPERQRRRCASWTLRFARGAKDRTCRSSLTRHLPVRCVSLWQSSSGSSWPMISASRSMRLWPTLPRSAGHLPAWSSRQRSGGCSAKVSPASARGRRGLRIRLCLDDDLIDLPWEFLYRPDGDAPAAQSGFLLTDGSISLTREPPSIVGAPCVRSSNFAPSTSRSAGACRGIPVRPPGDSLSQRRSPPLHHGPGNPECSRDAARAVEAACGDRLRTGSPESPLSRFGALIAGARPRA